MKRGQTKQRNLILFVVCLVVWMLSTFFLVRLGLHPSFRLIKLTSVFFGGSLIGMLIFGIRTLATWKKDAPAR